MNIMLLLFLQAIISGFDPSTVGVNAWQYQNPQATVNHNLGYAPQQALDENMIELKKNRLESLIRSIFSQDSLKLEVGEKWEFVQSSNTLFFPGEFLQLPEEAAIASIMDHFGLLKYSPFPEEFKTNLGLRLLYDTVERVRIGRFLSLQYMGYPALEEKAFNFDTQTYQGMPLPRYQQFCLGLISQYLGKTTSGLAQNPEVIQAIKDASPLVDRILNMPLSSESIFGDFNPKEIQLHANESLKIVKNDLWPIFKKLIDQDLQAMDSQDEQGQEPNEGDGQGNGSPSEGAPTQGSSASGSPRNGSPAGGSPSVGSPQIDQTQDQGQASEAVSGESSPLSLSEEQKQEMEKLLDAMGRVDVVPDTEGDSAAQGEGQGEGEGDGQGEGEGDGDGQGQGEGEGEGEGESKSDGKGGNGRGIGESENNNPNSQDPNQRSKQENRYQRLAKNVRQNLSDLTDRLRNRKPEKVTDGSKYEEAKSRIRHIIDRLEYELRMIFEDQAVFDYQSGYSSGDYDLQRGIAAELREQATGFRDQKVFRRKKVPQEKNVEIVLCLDKSGSMSGRDMDYAKDAVMAVGEAAEMLKVPWALISFDYNVRVLKDLEPNGEDTWKSELMDMQSGGGTDDLAALNSAVDLLEEQGSDSRKIILFMTDGQGDPGQNMRIRELSFNDDYIIIGVGMGEGASYVKHTYEESILIEDLKDLPKSLSSLLINVIAEQG